MSVYAGVSFLQHHGMLLWYHKARLCVAQVLKIDVVREHNIKYPGCRVIVCQNLHAGSAFKTQSSVVLWIKSWQLQILRQLQCFWRWFWFLPFQRFKIPAWVSSTTSTLSSTNELLILNCVGLQARRRWAGSFVSSRNDNSMALILFTVFPVTSILIISEYMYKVALRTNSLCMCLTCPILVINKMSHFVALSCSCPVLSTNRSLQQRPHHVSFPTQVSCLTSAPLPRESWHYCYRYFHPFLDTCLFYDTNLCIQTLGAA